MKQFDYEKTFMGVGDVSLRRKGEIRIDRYEYRMFNFLKHVKRVEGRICDVGSGGGEYLERIKILFPDAGCYGCDVSRKAIELARSLSSPHIKYRIIAEDCLLPYQDDFFDICTSFNVLEHMRDIEFNLREISRVLKSGGKFHLCVPCEGEPFTMTWFYQKTGFGKNFTYDNWGHVQQGLTHVKMLSCLESAGFRIEKITYSMHLPVDSLGLFFYFLPKRLLSMLCGDKAYQFTDAAIAQMQFENAERKSLLLLLRKFWIGALRVVSIFQSLDTILFANLAFTASTMHITCHKA
jgi:SAM-dependent methyltransferase